MDLRRVEWLDKDQLKCSAKKCEGLRIVIITYYVKKVAFDCDCNHYYEKNAQLQSTHTSEREGEIDR